MKETLSFYGTAAWKRARQQALDRDMGLCVWCRQRGRYARDRKGRRVPVLATMVHHIQHLEDRPDLALDLNNLVSLCDRCHDEAHPEKHALSGAARQLPQRGSRDDVPEVARGIRVERV